MWLAVIAVAVGLLAAGLGGIVGVRRSGGTGWSGWSGWNSARLARGWGRLRGWPLLLAGAACEFGADRWGSGPTGLAVLVVGYVFILGFAITNFRLTGMVLVALGVLANLTVITVDGGMPVRGAPAGVSFGPRHHGEQSSDRLMGLADVVRIPALGETVSAGDLVLALGVMTAVASLTLPRRRPA